jgi:hypothetical protein
MTVPNNANTYLPPVIQIPSALEITAISNSNPMIITTSMNSDQVNTYIPGQKVKLTVPVTFGMWQANNQIAQIIAVNGNELTLNINSINFDPFTIPPPGSLGPASIAPFGSQNLQFSNTTNLIGFQSANNIGN